MAMGKLSILPPFVRSWLMRVRTSPQTGLGMFELGSVRNKNVRQILNKHFLQAMVAVVS
jgi:ammonia channel protein AmtB